MLKKKQESPEEQTKTKTSKAEHHAIAKAAMKHLTKHKIKNEKRQENVAAEAEPNAIGNVSLLDFNDDVSTGSNDSGNSST